MSLHVDAVRNKITILAKLSVCCKKLIYYSETGCSFARHFALLSRNVGILIGSLLRASCDSNFILLPEQTVFHMGIL